ncbi:TRAFs-binding domain-containing protein [Alteraurantiacibacter aquimixticola]|uniref:DUF4071 domain-containing protein n=1 Tax=Alteraurantiacibacter aquimixticola TaxID=2489173 RepID=A0A4V6UGA5_9SPHN|nr:TRAFs-binding domain-containing protein [Alteraurantiacibacter aquimixticola]TIX49710.1 DUF4071 domain-containing protein [Alteraurantiacibacter aquimixticola]
MNLSTLRNVQRLARSGDTERAWRLFEASGLASAADNADALSLKGRLTKDRALKAAGEERSALFGQAQSAYLAAAALRPATYPLINAATIALLAGNREEAQKTAALILAMLDSGEHEPETEYWLKATRAEACLLHGRIDDARKALADAVRAAPAAWEDHASTLRQFRLILETLGEPSEWLDTLRPPASLHFNGIIHLAPDHDEVVHAIEDAVAELAPGFGFGPLAAGSDIIAAEAIVRGGGELHVVLPASIDAFRRESVGILGEDWIDRFDRLLETATTVETLPDLDEVSEAGIKLANQVAMGLAIRQARMLETHAYALRIGVSETGQPAARLLDEAWQAQGFPIHRLDAERVPPRSAPVPAFTSEAILVLPTSAAVEALVAAGGKVADRLGGQTAVSFADPVIAARAAMEVATVRDVPIGGDYVAFDPSAAGPERFDMAQLVANAATPGRVLLSRTMALSLALRGPEFDCESLGDIATAHGDVTLNVLISC